MQTHDPNGGSAATIASRVLPSREQERGSPCHPAAGGFRGPSAQRHLGIARKGEDGAGGEWFC